MLCTVVELSVPVTWEISCLPVGRFLELPDETLGSCFEQ